MSIRWEETETGAVLYSGSTAVGSVVWLDRPRGYDDYRWKLDLPGEPREGLAETIVEARLACLKAFCLWTAEADLFIKTNMG